MTPMPPAPPRTTKTPPPGKRAFDLALGLLLAVPVALVCAAVALILIAVQGRPVFYRSERMRTPDRAFTLWKFRTMSPVSGPPGVTGGQVSGRITPAGRVLRATRLDEFPQLWNVLRGEMSLVGPRPPLPSVVAAHPAIYARVLAQPPGITGLATLRYHRTEARLMARCTTQTQADALYARVCLRQKARLDRLYARRRTVWLDLLILWATVAGGRIGPAGRHAHRGLRPGGRRGFSTDGGLRGKARLAEAVLGHRAGPGRA